MSENPLKEILGDLLPYFESLEAKSSAILQLLRDKQIANDEELNRYIEKAEDASSVKWRAARVRIEHLFAVSPPLTTTPRAESHDKKEAKQTDDRSKAQPGAEADKPGTIGTAEPPNQSSSSPEMRPSSEKQSGNESKESSNDRPAESKASKSDSSDAEKTKPTSKAEKDAA